MSSIVSRVQHSVSVLQSARTIAEEDILKELRKLRDGGPLPSGILSTTSVGLVIRSVAKDDSLSMVVRSSAQSLLDSWRAEHRKRARFSHELVEKSAKAPCRAQATTTTPYPNADLVLGCKARPDEISDHGKSTDTRMKTCGKSNKSSADVEREAENAQRESPRTKVKHMLSEALRVGTVALRANLQGEQALRTPEPLSNDIEIALYHQVGSVSEKIYLRQARSIIHNIKDVGNESFRSKVLLGLLSPEKIVEMTAEEMASSSKRENRQRIRQDMLKVAAMSDPQGEFKCENCGGTLCRRSLGEVK